MTAIEAPFIFSWTGREAIALQVALRMTNDGFAAHLGVAVRTVAAWKAKPSIVPTNELQDVLDAAYRRMTDDPHRVRRFLHVLDSGQSRETTSPVVMAAEMTLMQARIDELQTQLKEQQS
ncbi:hypothetical protein ACIREE_11500 [Streptomyces sp. NPDC102467]|uniref:hypothetical protein n=1 Tax=Streptomyces sp. NPDC102467 TaxID=3366179 RepID=UPI00382EFA1F